MKWLSLVLYESKHDCSLKYILLTNSWLIRHLEKFYVVYLNRFSVRIFYIITVCRAMLGYCFGVKIMSSKSMVN